MTDLSDAGCGIFSVRSLFAQLRFNTRYIRGCWGPADSRLVLVGMQCKTKTSCGEILYKAPLKIDLHVFICRVLLHCRGLSVGRRLHEVTSLNFGKMTMLAWSKNKWSCNLFLFVVFLTGKIVFLFLFYETVQVVFVDHCVIFSISVRCSSIIRIMVNFHFAVGCQKMDRKISGKTFCGVAKQLGWVEIKKSIMKSLCLLCCWN